MGHFCSSGNEFDINHAVNMPLVIIAVKKFYYQIY